MVRPTDKLRWGVRNFRQWALRRMASLAGRRAEPSFVRPLIIAPHPDDETFGMGGLIAKRASGQRPKTGDLKLEGRNSWTETGNLKAESGNAETECHIVFLTSGGSAHAHCCGISRAELAARREAAARKAMAVLGVPADHLHFLRRSDGQLPHPGQPGFALAVDQLAELITQIQPDAVFAPHPFEGWSDHIAAEEITREALRRNAEMLKAETLKPGNGVSDCQDVSASKCLSSPFYYHYCVWFWFSMPLRRAFKLDWRNAVTIGENAENLITETLKPQSGSQTTEAGRQMDRAISKCQPFSLSAFSRKREAIRIYLEDLAPCGNPTCGVLPEEFLRAFEWEKELFFEVKI